MVDPERINVYERWDTVENLKRFRGAGPPDDQLATLREIRVDDYEVSQTA